MPCKAAESTTLRVAPRGVFGHASLELLPRAWAAQASWIVLAAQILSYRYSLPGHKDAEKDLGVCRYVVYNLQTRPTLCLATVDMYIHANYCVRGDCAVIECIQHLE